MSITVTGLCLQLLAATNSIARYSVELQIIIFDIPDSGEAALIRPDMLGIKNILEVSKITITEA